MKKKLKIKNDDHEVVTKGYLREQLDARFIPLEKNMNNRFERFENAVEIILKELGMMRQDHRELMQRCEVLDRNDVLQEIEHDKLEKRVFNLEIAK